MVADIEGHQSFSENKELELRNYQYTLDTKMAIPDDKESPYRLNEFMKSVTIFRRYEEHVYPIFQFSMLLPYRLFKLLTKNPDKVLFTLSIKKFILHADDEKPFRVPIYENVVLKAIDPPTPRIVQNENEGKNQIEANVGHYPVSLFLFKKEHLSVNKKLCDNTYNNVSVADVSLDLLNKNAPKDDSKLYIGKTEDGGKKYETVTIPPVNYADATKYIQKNYGLYSNGIQTWFDIKNGYIMNKNAAIDGPDPKKTVTRCDLEVYPIRDKVRQGTELREGSWYNEKDNLYLARTKQNFHVDNNNNSQNELLGENIKFLSNNQNNKGVQNCLNIAGKNGNDPEKDKESIYWNPSSNPMLETEMVSDKIRNQNPLTMVFKDFDIELFSINRIYNVKDLDTEQSTDVSGKYKLANEETLFTPDSGANDKGMCRCTVATVFKKVGELKSSEGTDSAAKK